MERGYPARAQHIDRIPGQPQIHVTDRAGAIMRDCFKRCSMCGKLWRSREAFLADPGVSTIGYTPNFEILELGLFLFNHDLCKTTLSIQAAEFTDLYHGPVFEERLTGTEYCPEYCLNEQALGRCPARCECAYVREILEMITRWDKTEIRSRE